MNKTYCFDKNYFIMYIFILFIIIFISFYYFQYNNQQEYSPPLPPQPPQPPLPQQTIILKEKYESNRSPKEINSLDRIYNPIRYPYKSDYFYDQGWYPNLELPFQVIGGGYRNTPTLGGTQIPIYNPPVSIDISNRNIAPVNISTRGPIGQPQQIGVIYKINGNDNDMLPLFGRKKYPNDNKYEYYTIMGQYGVKVPVITKNRNDELGNNDMVFIKGRRDSYRVTIYESDFPSYIPYV